MIEFELNTTELDELLLAFVKTDKTIKEHGADVLDWVGRKFTVVMRDIVREIEFEGNLRRSIGYEVAQNKESVIIGPNIPSGEESERKIRTVYSGRPEAHYVPIDDLKPWAAHRFGDAGVAYYIQKRIAGEIEGKPGGVSRATEERRQTPDFPFTDMALSSPTGKAIVIEAAERLTKRLVASLIGDE